MPQKKFAQLLDAIKNTWQDGCTSTTNGRKEHEQAYAWAWEIHWYECRADREDVKAKSAKRVGDLLWRVPKQIGPISAEENHWARLHLDVSEEDSRLIAAAPELYALAERIARLNKDAGEIGAGMLASLVDESNRIIEKVEK